MEDCTRRDFGDDGFIMTIDEVKEIISSESLKHYNLFEEHEISEHEIIISKIENKWKVAATDERSCVITGSEVIFENKVDALNNFLNRLRSLNRIRK